MNILAERYSWMANELNKEAYSRQIAGRKTALRQFTPCEMAVRLTAAISENPIPVTSIVFYEAVLISCRCHFGFGLADMERLYDLAIDAIPHEIEEWAE